MFKTGYVKRCYLFQCNNENNIIFWLATQFIENKGVNQTGFETYFN